MLDNLSIFLKRILCATLGRSTSEWAVVRFGPDNSPAMRRLGAGGKRWEYREMNDSEREEYLVWWSIK